MARRLLGGFLILILLSGGAAGSQDEAQQTRKYWVFFKDKGIHSFSKRAAVEASVRDELSERALKRRRKLRAPDHLVDEHDFPVHPPYLEHLRALGHAPVVISRWLNAASFWLTPAQAGVLGQISFVDKIQPVAGSDFRPRPIELPRPEDLVPKPTVHKFDYGPSLTQNALINVPAVHDLGITGRGVWVGMIDTGYKYRDHEAFQRLHVIAERDFIHDDEVTQDEPGQDPPNQERHGTRTLSIIGGMKEGSLVGVAFDAGFMLAKTEILDQEIPREEDLWVAAIEWFEREGVDVVSSSVGYPSFYQTSQMDGNTAVTTVAADLAVSRGVVVVNSAGNEGRNSWRIVIPPADGDEVLAVGAMKFDSTLADFSSVGPTADGRVKPDVVAPGVDVQTALPTSDKHMVRYVEGDGTSFACPLASGVVALMLSARPWLTPSEVREALRQTASRAEQPDNQFGWGVVNALQAVLYHGPVFSNLPEVRVNTDGSVEVSIKVASKHGLSPAAVRLHYRTSAGSDEQQLAMAPTTEKHEFMAVLADVIRNDDSELRLYFSVTDSADNVAVHPYWAPDSTFVVDASGLQEPGPFRPPDTFVLKQNYPNPFNPGTTIEFDLPESANVRLEIYNILGRRIRVLLNDAPRPAGVHTEIWDGTNDAGVSVSAGIYFYRLQANDFSDVKKMTLVR